MCDECNTDNIARPIATAPRDGTVFIGIDDLGYPHLIWGDERGFFDDATGEIRDDLRWWGLIPTIATIASPLAKRENDAEMKNTEETKRCLGIVSVWTPYRDDNGLLFLREEIEDAPATVFGPIPDEATMQALVAERRKWISSVTTTIKQRIMVKIESGP